MPDGTEVATPWVVGLRDRALIAVMTYSLARIGAVVAMRVEDYYPEGKRRWLPLHKKGGKRHERPVHHKLEVFLDEYLDAARAPRRRPPLPLRRRQVEHAHGDGDDPGGCVPHDPPTRRKSRV
jgi:integrase